jgi:hypothetical protein
MEFMMKILRSAIVVLAIGAASISSALARDSFSIGINVGGPAYYQPTRYYAAPPVVYYGAPPVVYYNAAPRVYHYPPAVSFGYQNYGYRNYGYQSNRYDNRWGNGWGDRGNNGHRGHGHGRGHR